MLPCYKLPFLSSKAILSPLPALKNTVRSTGFLYGSVYRMRYHSHVNKPSNVVTSGSVPNNLWVVANTPSRLLQKLTHKQDTPFSRQE